MEVTCIYKFRDNTGKIIGYKLQDANRNIQDIGATELKNLIASNKLKVDNLTLTSDGRLMSTTPKISDSSDFSLRKEFKGEHATKDAPTRKNPKDTFAEIDDIAVKAAALLGMYKYNADVKIINKVDCGTRYYGDMTENGTYYFSDYNILFNVNNQKPENLKVIIRYNDDVSDRSDSTEIHEGEIETKSNQVDISDVFKSTVEVKVYRCGSRDILSEFEVRLRDTYKNNYRKQSIKNKMTANKLIETEYPGDKDKKVSIFSLFKR
jgi:hypothetical protein